MECIAGKGDANTVRDVITKRFREVDVTTFRQEALEQHFVDREIAHAAVIAWRRAFPMDLKDAKKLHCELKLQMPLLPAKDGMPEVIFEGTIDLAKETDSELDLRDYKSTATLDDSFVQQAYVSRQFKGYTFLAHNHFKRWPSSFTVCGIEKPKIRKKKGETDGQFFQRIHLWYRDQNGACFIRHPIVFDRGQLRAFWQQTVHIATLIRYAITHSKDAVWFKNCGACKQKFGQCEYLPICANGDNVNKVRYRKLTDGEDQERRILR